jgi:hypothetical protein
MANALILSFDSIGRIYRDGPDRRRETDKLRSGARVYVHTLELIPPISRRTRRRECSPLPVGRDVAQGETRVVGGCHRIPGPFDHEHAQGNVERARLQRGNLIPRSEDRGTEESEEKKKIIARLNVQSMNGGPTSRSCC